MSVTCTEENRCLTAAVVAVTHTPQQAMRVFQAAGLERLIQFL